MGLVPLLGIKVNVGNSGHIIINTFAFSTCKKLVKYLRKGYLMLHESSKLHKNPFIRCEDIAHYFNSV